MALRRHLDSDTGTSLAPALRLGRRAVTLGMETLDVVRVHEQAIEALASPGAPCGNSQEMIDWAKVFFAEVIVPIEKTHQAAMEAGDRVKQLNLTLRQRTREALTGRRQLKLGVARRQTAEAALKRSGKQHARLVAESLRLQKHLRSLTREVLSAQESERLKTSRQLHDEIAQALLAINIRLLALKNAARANTEDLKKEIAETQRLVTKAVRTISRLAHEREDDNEA